jgi:hypothetical protein
MQKRNLLAALLLATALPAFASPRIQGKTTLKDFKPLDAAAAKKAHQAYDLLFTAEGKNYTCRTDPSKSVNATDFVVGTEVSYEVDGKNGKIKTAKNKKVECKIVRVEAATATAPQ